MQWYYAKDRVQSGPVGEEELRTKIASGEVAATDLVWREGMTDWLPSAKVPEFQSALARELSTTGEAPDPMPPVNPESGANPVSPYVSPVYGNQGPMIVVSSGKATASMVLGIISLVFCLCACTALIITLPCAIIAIVLGMQAKTEIQANPLLIHERSKAASGIIMGWIALGVGLGLFVLRVVLNVSLRNF